MTTAEGRSTFLQGALQRLKAESFSESTTSSETISDSMWVAAYNGLCAIFGLDMKV